MWECKVLTIRATFQSQDGFLAKIWFRYWDWCYIHTHTPQEELRGLMTNILKLCGENNAGFPSWYKSAPCGRDWEKMIGWLGYSFYGAVWS